MGSAPAHGDAPICSCEKIADLLMGSRGSCGPKVGLALSLVSVDRNRPVAGSRRIHSGDVTTISGCHDVAHRAVGVLPPDEKVVIDPVDPAVDTEVVRGRSAGLLAARCVVWLNAANLSGNGRCAEAGESQQGDRKQAAALQDRPGETRHLKHGIDLQSDFLFE